MWTDDQETQLAGLWTTTRKTQREIAEDLERPQSSARWKAHELGLAERGPAPARVRTYRPLLDLEHGMCRYPVNNGSPYLFCSEPRERLDLESDPYCAYHRRISRVGRR